MALEVRLSEIGQVARTVTDIDAAVDFYANKLGMELLFRVPPKMAFFSNGSVRLMLSEGQDASARGNGTILYYRTSDIEQTTAALRDRGVTFTGDPHLVARMPDHELWMSFFEDPDGNPAALMEERTP